MRGRTRSGTTRSRRRRTGLQRLIRDGPCRVRHASELGLRGTLPDVSLFLAEVREVCGEGLSAAYSPTLTLFMAAELTRHTQDAEGRLHFSVDAQILFQIGEQLVARQSIALAELIKNGYDADARRVTVLFENVRDRRGGEILVQDDGLGMTLPVVRDYWMRIATANKQERAVSPILHRPLSGAKGVGRFAARKLGDYLLLHSVANGERGLMQTTVDFDWDRAFQPGMDITEVGVPFSHRPVASSPGTLLQIRGTREPWSERDIREVRDDLITLVHPFRYAENSVAAIDRRPFDVSFAFPEGEGFDVELEAPEFPDLDGSLVDLVLGGSWCSIAGHIIDGYPHYRIRIRETGEDLRYKGDEPRYELVPNATFLIYYFPKDSEHYDDLDVSSSRVKAFLREQAGVRVYLDGFRVFSYGSPADDWLELAATSARRAAGPFDFSAVPGGNEALRSDRPALLLPRSNQLFGTVELSRDQQPDIVVSADRERLADNAAFDQLQRFVQEGVTYMTVQYARVTSARRRARQAERKASTSSSQVREAQRRVQTLSESVSRAARALPEPESQLAQELQDDVAALQEALEAAHATVTRQEDEHISERSMLRVLASAGTVVGVINHQLHTLVAQTRAVDESLAHAAAAERPDPAAIREISKSVAKWRHHVERQLALLGLLMSREARERRRRLALRPIVEGIAGAFGAYTDEFNIDVKVAVPDALRTPPVFEAELSAILTNALSNSFKAVLRRESRRVRVEAERLDNAMILRVLDTGTGVLPADRERVFEPFYTTSVADPVLGVGTGLGLTVIRDVVGFYGGAVDFVDAPPPWTTSLELTLPYP